MIAGKVRYSHRYRYTHPPPTGGNKATSAFCGMAASPDAYSLLTETKTPSWIFKVWIIAGKFLFQRPHSHIRRNFKLNRFCPGAFTKRGEEQYLYFIHSPHRRTSTVFFHQADVLNAHRFLSGFRHIINGQRRDRDRSQRFHLDAGFAGDFGGGSDQHARQRIVKRKIDIHFGERQGMT